MIRFRALLNFMEVYQIERQSESILVKNHIQPSVYVVKTIRPAPTVSNNFLINIHKYS